MTDSLQNYFVLEDNSIVIYKGVMLNPVDEIIFEKDNYFIFAGSLLPQSGIFDFLFAFIKFSKSVVEIRFVICATEVFKIIIKLTTLLMWLVLNRESNYLVIEKMF